MTFGFEVESCMCRQRGLSIIELMVALVIGVIITFGATTLFLQSKRSYLQDEEVARVQENGRYVLRLLNRELSMSGFYGRVLRGDLVTSAPSGTDCFNYLVDTDLPFEHHNNVSANGVGAPNDPNMPAGCLVAGEHEAGTDMLVVRRSTDRPNYEKGTTLEALDPNAVYLRIVDDNVAITLERGGGATGSTIDIWEYSPNILFIRDHAITSGDGIPALCRRRISTGGNDVSAVECLAEGVENLQVEFGVDLDGDLQVDQYLDAPTSVQMGAAMAAKVYILVRSGNEIPGYTDDKVYTLGQTVVPAHNDGFYRKVMQTTVLLRNSEAFKF
ncbi:PilW family protein [Parahaliea maris]|nr:PilW family protein [Parahaliea maris]